MSPFSRDRELLEQEIADESYKEMLKVLQEKEPFLSRFGSWPEVIKFMHKKVPPHESEKDNVLRAILRAHKKDKDHRWRTVLLVMFWPALDSLHSKKSKWDADPSELWQNILWTFIQVICRLDFENRSHRLVQKLINQTAHRLHDEYQRIWKHSERETPVEREELEELAGGVEGIELDAIESREKQEADIEQLRSYVEEGTIRESDLKLLVATRIYGQRLVDYTRKAGIPYEFARRRRLQVEAKIERKKREKEKI